MEEHLIQQVRKRLAQQVDLSQGCEVSSMLVRRVFITGEEPGI